MLCILLCILIVIKGLCCQMDEVERLYHPETDRTLEKLVFSFSLFLDKWSLINNNYIYITDFSTTISQRVSPLFSNYQKHINLVSKSCSWFYYYIFDISKPAVLYEFPNLFLVPEVFLILSKILTFK